MCTFQTRNHQNVGPVFLLRSFEIETLSPFLWNIYEECLNVYLRLFLRQSLKTIFMINVNTYVTAPYSFRDLED